MKHLTSTSTELNVLGVYLQVIEVQEVNFHLETFIENAKLILKKSIVNSRQLPVSPVS